MSIPGAASPLFLGAAVAEAAAYQIDRSVRLNSADSAHFSRTPSSAGNRRTFTFSTWIKRHKLGTDQKIFGVNSNWFTFYFTSDNLRVYYENAGSQYFITDAVFRDVSAWYHLVLKVDTTQSSASDRVKIYANGQELSFSSTGTTSQNYEFGVNTTNVHDIGMRSSESNMKADFSLADIHFIDGQALAPTDFGEYDSNNVWQPKDASGLTFGTNGFHLDFSNPSDLGADAAGSNDWTPNNLVGTAPGLSTANQGMDVVTYTGNGGTQSITGLNFQPDFVWIKSRNASHNHMLFDVVRGAGADLQSNSTAVENAAGSNDLTSFNSNGFSLGSNNAVNQSSVTFVGWCWKANGSASSNSNGSITSSVSANTTYGFSVVTYTGTGSAGATVGHGLGSVPKFMLVKNRSGADIMVAYHESVGNTGALRLTNAATDTGFNWWNSTTPSSSVFTIGNTGATNNSSDNYVAYCWSEISGFSKFGSYTGTGSAHHVELGFRPRYLLYKSSTVSGTNWHVYDSARNNGGTRMLPNLTAGDSGPSADSYAPTFTDTGFTVAAVSDGHTNASGQTYIYAAFADKPDGSIIDSLIDTPTNYEAASGNNGGNYPTFNPLSQQYSSANHVLTNGNLQVGDSSTAKGNYALEIATMAAPPSGKWYWEMTLDDANSAERRSIGVVAADADFATYLPQDNLDDGFVGLWCETGQKIINGSRTSYGASATDGDIIGVALDQDGDTVTFYKNNSSQGSISLPTNMQGKSIFAAVISIQADENVIGNWGQRPFFYTPPTNHKSLCTQNLPDPTIADGSTAFDAKLYTGNASTQAVTGLNFSPDLVWLKRRDAVGNHNIQDVVRGASAVLQSDYNGAEFSNSPRLASFDSNGFTLTSDNGGNASGGTYVGWAWDGGTTTATNTDGSITSSVRASQANGFSITTWTGNGNNNESVGHGLNAAPSIVIIKCRSTATSWHTYVRALDSTGRYQLYLNSTSGTADFGTTFFDADNSVINLVGGTSVGINGNGSTYVAYSFAPVAGYSAFGKWTGGSDAFVYLGFRPKFLLVKATAAGNDWLLFDSERSTFNLVDDWLTPNSSAGETQNNTVNYLDFLSNGFKIKGTSGYFGASVDIIYAAFGDPFKTARAR